MHDNADYVTLDFADTEQEANLLAEKHWRDGRSVAVVRVTDSEALIGRQIKAVSRYAVVGEK